jgi:hypothetical protein
MPQVIRVRDIARDGTYELGPDEPILRVPYDLFHPTGSVKRSGPLVEWVDAGTIRRARVAPAALGDTQPGQRVLLNLPPHAENEWWLCDVEAVDGSAANP